MVQLCVRKKKQKKVRLINLHQLILSPLPTSHVIDYRSYMTPRLKSLVLWENPSRSAAHLGVSLALVLSCRWISLLNVACAALVFGISGSFIYVNGVLLFNRITSKPAVRPLEYVSTCPVLYLCLGVCFSLCLSYHVLIHHSLLYLLFSFSFSSVYRKYYSRSAEFLHIESDTIHSRVDRLTDGLNVILTELAKIVLVEDNKRSAIVSLFWVVFFI